MSKKFIVVTSIFPPTEAIEKFAKVEGWQLIVVGDKKTPEGWAHDNVIYLSPEKQQSLNYKVTELLPWNHYCRKIVGYLYAIEQGAEVIADSDDDNIPYENWPSLPDPQESLKTLSGSKFANIYKHFTDEFIWPRGYPLDRILQEEKPEEATTKSSVGVWQFLADEDPDVDAIYRLTNNKLVTFDKGAPIVLGKGTVSPFNSQNTIFRKELFPLLYLPSFVTFRFTDILRGLIAQPLMWTSGYHLGIGQATVIQKRNPHNYLKDFESEVPVYLNSEKVIDLVSSITKDGEDIGSLLLKAYETLLQSKIVTSNEIELVKLWLLDIKRVTQ